jgi:twitching motility protein PilT
VLLNNSAVANLIRENKLAQISSVMQMNAANGMQLLDQQLAKLVKENIITMPTALDACQSALAFQQYVQHN